ncbi:MAG: PfkB family carbohydrate kinase, partial [Pseudomonadota bacterium]
AGWLREAMPQDLQATLADTRWPDGALVAMQTAKDQNIPGIIDAEAPVAEASEALKIASHIAFSEQGAEDFTGLSDPEQAALEAAKSLSGQVIVTAGERGVVRIVDGTAVWHQAHAITVVDTLAAGDVWHAAFAVALADGMDEGDAIDFASTAAAIKCARPGGRNGAPTREEVLNFSA